MDNETSVKEIGDKYIIVLMDNDKVAVQYSELTGRELSLIFFALLQNIPTAYLSMQFALKQYEKVILKQ